MFFSTKGYVFANTYFSVTNPGREYLVWWNVQRLSGNACFYQMIIYGYNDIDMDTSIDIDIDMDTMIYWLFLDKIA